MLLSRFFYVVLGLAVGALVFMLSLAQGMYNRAGDRARAQGLSADSQVVSSYLKDDSRMRSAQLVKFALDGDIIKGLQAASKSETELDEKYRDQVTKGLKNVQATVDAEAAFDAVFAVDQHGRVVGQVGYPQAGVMKDFELGGYPVVADALHGYIRDDTLVWSRIYRVVARPVQVEAGSKPAGAIVGARVLDDTFARELSERTGAAVAFYVNGSRTAAGAPEGFPKASLDQIVSDLESLQQDEDYKEKGRSAVREIGETLSVQYTRLPGEAYMLGAGVAVARETSKIASPFGFFEAADDKDKQGADKILAGGLMALAVAIGLVLSFLEHSLPLKKFRLESEKLAKGETDQLQPSRFRGVYRKIAADLNDGIDKVASSSGGQSRKATNLEDVLGDLPAEPQMAAFSVPLGPEAGPGPGIGLAPFPVPASNPLPAPLPQAPGRPAPPPRGLPTPPAPVAQAVGQAEVDDVETEWKGVYDQFVSLKQQCGEPTEGFTYDKFRKTLVKNRDALVARHGVSRVKFSVYVKDGKAALKASPVK